MIDILERVGRMRFWIIGVCTLLLLAAGHAAGEDLEIRIGYLRAPEPRTAISLLDVPAENNGVAGARLAIEDNNTTGRFLRQRFVLDEMRIEPGQDAAAAALALGERGAGFIIADLRADALLRAADAGRASGLLFFNVSAPDERLREEDCRANVIHTAPSRAMLADALAQYLVWKRWRNWLLVAGSHPEDKLLAEAYRRAAKRFGAKIVQERVFEDRGGARRTDSGVVQVQRQMPVFTQGAPAYDVLLAADENDVFAPYLPYRTWDARPVAGSAGLVPTSWHAAHDLWGAVQLQNRFIKMFSRHMTALDMQAWSAVRIIGEAAARRRTAERQALIGFITGPELSLAAFKGQKLSLRDWNLQLRQPILLVDGRTVVSVSPQEGFLHQTSELDTLGYDRPETKCRLR